MRNNGQKLKKDDFAPVLNNAISNTDMASHLKSGFRSCGLFPFDANAISYQRLIKNTKNEVLLQPQVSSFPESTNLTTPSLIERTKYLKYFEAFIEIDVLTLFKNSTHQWEGDDRYLELFNVWRKISCNIQVPLESEEAELSPECYILEADWLQDMFNNGAETIDLELPVISYDAEVPNAQTISLLTTVIPIPIQERSEESEINKNTHHLTTPIKESAAGTSMEAELGCVPTPFKMSFFWPEAKVVEDSTKKARQKLPAVASSEAWLEYQQRKQQQKDNEASEKMKKRALRENRKTVREKKENTHSKEHTMPCFSSGDFVIFTYEEEYFPGAVVAVKDNKEILISAMMMSGNGWKWPAKEDRLWYREEDIKEVITKPVPQNKRGVFSVPEIEKYQKKQNV